MARVTPPQGNAVDVSELRDFEAYPATLVEVDVVTDEKFGSGLRAALMWELEDETRSHIRDWAPIKLGKMQNGQVSKMRGLVNAIAGRPSHEDIGWIDDETLEFSLTANGPVEGRIEPGARVMIRGQIVPDAQDPSVMRYRIRAYEARSASRRATTPAAPARAGGTSMPPSRQAAPAAGPVEW